MHEVPVRHLRGVPGVPQPNARIRQPEQGRTATCRQDHPPAFLDGDNEPPDGSMPCTTRANACSSRFGKVFSRFALLPDYVSQASLIIMHDSLLGGV